MATNTNQAPTGRPSQLIDRLNAMDSRTNTPMACPDCGGTFFYRVSAEQFSDAGYGSAQFRSLSMTSEPVYICLCGRIAQSKDTVNTSVEGNHTRFLATLQAVLKYQSDRKKQIHEIAGQAATSKELDSLEARVRWLENAIEPLLQTPLAEDEAGETEVYAVKETTGDGQGAAEPETKPAPEPDPAPAPKAPPLEQVSKPIRTGRPAKQEKAAA